MSMGGGTSIKTYQLGAVEISAPKQVDYNPSATNITSKDIKDSNSDNIAEAIRMTPGVMFQNPRGGMGQSNVKMRGFSSSRLGFYLDGIPMMGAYDRSTDYTHFVTQGVSNIQISKSFTSPIYGSNAMGGAVNIVSAKPEKEIEFSLRYKWLHHDESRVGVSVGTNQGKYYFQTEYSITDRMTYPLPNSFKGTPAQPSGKKDSRYFNSVVKLKAGIMPNENHEYSLNYINQRGKRSGVYPEGGGANWFFPHHDKQTVYLLGNSYFTPDLSLNTRLYYDEFYSQRDIGYCIRADGTLGLRYSGNDTTAEARCNPLGTLNMKDKDNVIGGILTLSYDIYYDANVKFGTNIRKDNHTRKETISGIKNTDVEELTSSIFAQYAQRLGDFHFIVATSYDKVDSLDTYNRTNGGLEGDTNIKIKGNFSLQGIAYYELSEGQNIHITIGKKQNIPTMSQRYPSSNFGSYMQNPNLKPESVINYELGYDLNLQSTSTRLSASIFYDDKNNIIISKDVPGDCPTATGGLCTQYQNAYEGYTYGGEVGFEQGFFSEDALLVGVNYSYLQQKNSSGTKLTQYPHHMFNAKVAIKPLQKLEFIGLSTYESPQNVNSDGSLRDSAYFTLDLQANYELIKGLNLNAGVLNVTDKANYVTWANPRDSKLYFAGRRFFAGFDYRYSK